MRALVPLLLSLLVVIGPSLGPSPLTGQEAAPDESRAFPFAPPLASPLEPRTRLAPVHVDRDGRSRWVGQVDLGERVPFWLVRGRGGPDAFSLAGSVAGGAFSRFDLEDNGNELIETHFRVGVRLRARMGDLEARGELYHVSSHLGDEFLERTGRRPVSTSREGVELLLQGRPASALRVYGGPGLLLRSTEGLDAASVRLGTEWRGADDGVRWGPFAPYTSLEAFLWEELDWDPMVSGEAGVAFGGGHFRAALVAGRGPSRAEQFLREGETLWGFSLSISR